VKTTPDPTERREAVIRMVTATAHQRAKVATLKTKLRDAESLLAQMERGLVKLIDGEEATTP
jgi:hypothetical protein